MAGNTSLVDNGLKFNESKGIFNSTLWLYAFLLREGVGVMIDSQDLTGSSQSKNNGLKCWNLLSDRSEEQSCNDLSSEAYMLVQHPTLFFATCWPRLNIVC